MSGEQTPGDAAALEALDLFSGGESWKRAAEEKDYQYVGVDIRSYIQKADEQSN